MLLGLGIPVWWYTTAVHRANLPDLESLGLPAGSRKISIVYKSAEEPHKLSAKLKNVQRIVQKRCKVIFSTTFMESFFNFVIGFPSFL